MEDRAVPGLFELDLIISAHGASAVGTIVEQTTRLALPLQLPNGHSAPKVEGELRKTIKTLQRSITKDTTYRAVN